MRTANDRSVPVPVSPHEVRNKAASILHEARRDVVPSIRYKGVRSLVGTALRAAEEAINGIDAGMLDMSSEQDARTTAEREGVVVANDELMPLLNWLASRGEWEFTIYPISPGCGTTEFVVYVPQWRTRILQFLSALEQVNTDA